MILMILFYNKKKN